MKFILTTFNDYYHMAHGHLKVESLNEADERIIVNDHNHVGVGVYASYYLMTKDNFDIINDMITNYPNNKVEVFLNLRVRYKIVAEVSRCLLFSKTELIIKKIKKR